MREQKRTSIKSESLNFPHVKPKIIREKKNVSTASDNRGHLSLENKGLEGKQLFLNKSVRKR